MPPHTDGVFTKRETKRNATCMRRLFCVLKTLIKRKKNYNEDSELRTEQLPWIVKGHALLSPF
jgi:hypothetical protein